MRDLPIRLNPARAAGFERRKLDPSRPMADLLESPAAGYITDQPMQGLVSAAFFFLLAFVFVSFGQFPAWLPGYTLPESTQPLSGAAWLVAQVRLSLTSSLLALGCILVYKAMHHEKPLFAGPQAHLLALFVVCGLVSAPFSMYPTHSLWFSISDLGGLLLLYLLVTNVIRNLRGVRIFLWVLVLCGCIPAVGAILGNLWPDMFAIEVGPSGRIGWAGYFANANRLAHTMCQLVPLALALMSLTRSYACKAFLIGLICMFLMVMLLMLSRAAMITTAMMALVYCISSRNKTRSVAIAFVVALVGLMAVPAALPRLRTVAAYQLDASAMSRLYLWEAGIDLGIRHPLTGIGVDTFPIAMAEYYTDDQSEKRLRWMSPHSSYVQVLAEMGFIGLAAYLGLIIVTLRDAWRVHTRLIDSPDDSTRQLAVVGRALFLAMLANMLLGMTGHMAYDWLGHVLVALIVCLKQMAGPATSGAALPAEQR